MIIAKKTLGAVALVLAGALPVAAGEHARPDQPQQRRGQGQRDRHRDDGVAGRHRAMTAASSSEKL